MKTFISFLSTLRLGQVADREPGGTESMPLGHGNARLKGASALLCHSDWSFI